MIIRKNGAYVDFFKETGEFFSFLNLADIQLCTRDWLWKTKIYKSLDRQLSFLLKYNPDFITMSGDQGYNHYFANKFMASYFHRIGKPWSFVFGNHDYEEYTISLSTAEKIATKKQSCLYLTCDKALGYGNYVYRFFIDKKIVRAIIFMDSGDGSISKEQIQWYEKNILDLKIEFGILVPTTIITHAPFEEFSIAFTQKYGEGKEYISKEDKIIRKEKIHTLITDNGMFDKILELGSTDTILVGHDHLNAYNIDYNNISLIATVKTGLGGKGSKEINGGTIFSFTANKWELNQVFLPIE